MKRSLILLLVLAIVAMMIPGFALAEDVSEPVDPEFKITPSKDSIALTYDYYGWGDSGITIKAENYGDEWYLSLSLPEDQKIVVFSDEDGDESYYYGRYFYGSVASLPEFRILGEGETKMRVYAHDEDNEYDVSMELPIKTTKAAAIETVEFDKSTMPVEALELTVGQEKSYANYLKITPDDKPTYYSKYNGILWSVSDPKIAKVDIDGWVTGLAAGSVTLYAVPVDKPDAAKAELTLTVKEAKEEEKPVEKGPTLVFSTRDFTLEKGKSESLGNYLKKLNPVKDDSYIWTTSDESIVTVDNYGNADAVEIGGPVTITVRSKLFPTSVETCTVTVVKAKKQLESISFTGVPATIKLGDTLGISAFLNIMPTADAAKYINSLVWTSSDPQVAYVSGTTLNTCGIGKATITATYKEDTSKTGSFDIEVIPVPITKINFVKSAYTLLVDSEYTFYRNEDYTFEPSNYTQDSDYYDVTWTSDNDEVVSIYRSEMTAESVGEANITMTVRNADGSVVVSDPIKVTVTDKAPTAIGFKKDAYTFKLSNKKKFKSMALKLTPADAFVEDGDLYVESSDPTVATATVDGTDVTVTAYKGGETTLTVKSHTKADLTGSTKFTVDPIKLESVSLEEKIDLPYFTDAKGNIVTSSNKEIKATINPSDAFFKATWETSDPSVVLVDGDEDSRYADILPVGAGTAKVTVTMTDGTNTLTATTTVTVKAAKVTKLALSATKATVYRIKGEENTLQLTATDTKTDVVVPVTWASSNKKIATVSKTGLVTFKKAGSVNITATTKDGNKTKATCKLTIKQLKVTKVVPAKKTMTMKVGDEATLVVNLKPAKAFNKTLAFKSSNKKVVTVDAEGNVTAVKAGKAVITITAKDGSKKSAKVTITVKGAASNAIDEIGDVAVDAENDIELTLDSIDGIDNIDDLFIDGEVALEANDAGVVEIG